MAILYCPHCGYKNEYTLNTPTFCGGCGKKVMGENTPKAQTRNKAKARSRGREVVSDYETDVDEVPDMSGLDVDVDLGGNRVIKGSEVGFIEEEEVKR